MDCALWLNRRKIRSADEIAGNSDIASLRGYFLAGSLIEWLNEHGGEHYAEKLSELRPDDPELNIKLAEIFGGSVGGKRFGDGAPLSDSFPDARTNMRIGSGGTFGSGGALGSFGASGSAGYFGSGYAWGGSGGSFSFGSRFFGSGMHEWEWEWLFNFYKSGSFSFGSFGSFHEWEWLFEIFRSGSFSVGSFKFGSFWGEGRFFGSLYLPFAKGISALDEYDRIMFETLMMCPLDRFGYGIHNI